MGYEAGDQYYIMKITLVSNIKELCLKKRYMTNWVAFSVRQGSFLYVAESKTCRWSCKGLNPNVVDFWLFLISLFCLFIYSTEQTFIVLISGINFFDKSFYFCRIE